MKKIALLIGHSGSSEDYIPGVKKDIKSYKRFLLSPYGGGWFKEEIVDLYNKEKDAILEVINKIKQFNSDFVFTVFSGHGDYYKPSEERRLYLEDEYIYESDLRGMAKKQLIIIDSCAGIEEEVFIKEAVMESVAAIRIEKDYRKIYEEYLKSCPNQEIILYSSSEGEFSEDIGTGGLYTVSLLETIYENREFEIFNALIAHEQASEKVVEKSKGRQHPDYLLTRRSGKKLPISLRVV